MAIPAKTKVTINLVAFVVLGLGLSYLMATQVLAILQDRYSVLATFPNTGGVFTDQEVTYRGVTVGQVGELEVVEEGVEIELLIDEATEIPKEGIEARVQFRSAVGEQFVDLLPGSDGPPFLEDGSQIPIEQTSIPVSSQELLATLEAVLRGVPPESLEGAVDALGEGLTGRGQDIATILRSSAEIAELFARRAPEVQNILEEGTKVGGAFLASKEDFAEAIRQLVTVSESLKGSTGDIERLLKGTNLTSDELVALIRNNDEELDEFLIEFAEVNDLQAEHAGDLSRIFARLPTALGNVNKAFEPKTGLVRFGSLFNESAGQACSFGTERRQPTARSERMPPKRASCGEDKEGGRASHPFSAVATTSGGPRLPVRMADWSWSLFYLNSM